MQQRNSFKFSKAGLLSVLILALFWSFSANAHRGAKNEVDTCRFSVGSEVIHFSAYTPDTTGGQGFCHVIPDIGMTHLVFDYEGKNLRNTTVEFEVTKDPDDTRVYYQAPEKIRKGSVDAQVDFTKFGAGTYLAHVTIMYKGEKLDSHLPFAVGMDPDEGSLPYKIIIPIVLVIITLIVVSVMTKKRESGSDDEGME